MNKIAAVVTLIASFVLVGFVDPPAHAQGSRKDDIVFGPSGHPIAGATITVCQSTATGTPCSPLATLYTDATLTTTAPNPFQGDGIGNYHFYAPAGRYMVQITGPGISGTLTYPDVILPADLSSTGSGNNISAFGLALGGNLTVSGNATVNGTLTTTSFNPGTLTPSSLAVSGNESVAGPRPYIDVTAPPYNAKGDNSTNDTAAIQSAITAACNTTISGVSYHPDVFFPPGSYIVAQPQTPSTASPLTIPCGALRLIGGGGSGSPPQFFNGSVAIILVSPGSSPNSAALISAVGNNNLMFDHIGISGYNEAVSIRGANIEFDHAVLSFQNTGMTDNTALRVSNSLWVWFRNGVILGLAGSSAPPSVLIIGEGTVGNNTTALVFFENDTMSGAGVVYDQRAAIVGGVPSQFVFRNVTIENYNTSFFTQISSASIGYTLLGVEFDHLGMSDAIGTGPYAVFKINDSGGSANAIRITQSGGSGNPAVLQQSGTVISYFVDSCLVYCTSPPQDANGNLINGGASQTQSGFDFSSPANQQPLTDMTAAFNGQAFIPGPPIRFGVPGNTQASLALDPVNDILFGDGLLRGFHSAFASTARDSIDVQFAATNPPTNLAGSATTGGSLSAATYYFALYPQTVSSNCSTSTSTGAPDVLNTGIAISGSNNAVALTWTPSAAGMSALTGYCLAYSTSPIIGMFAENLIFISGGSTSSFTFTGQTPVARIPNNFNTMVSAHRFTPTSLGVNTTNPQFNLDVNGSAAVNSLNGVQKAERFSGSDAAAKINACLTAASTSGGVCDARGMTGALSGASHVQIPAGTTLFWGTAQLTVNDTTNNDAIELMGDGSSLIGYQESGSGTVPRPDSSGFIACQPAGCTTVKNPNAGTRNVDWVHISGMNLQATGASSVVLNLTSVGHADIENNRFVMGTGGNSYGIFGDTSTGGFDSTNTLIKHNEIDPQYQNDRCLHLAGVFNVVEMEQNNCILPSANTGTVCFEIAKDSSGNYPNNDEFYGNDCEGSSTSFGQIGYNIINADSVTIGPNNRCENVYNCFQFPVDGSAVGIHLLDPYISVSAVSVLKPNEPSTAQIAIDNNGPNWLPSMHYGFNDLASHNLLGNAAFEGWSNSTTLYYWGGVNGTNINQAGSGIYAQNTSAGTPADGTTQGTYNVKIGDNATAGLGVNSACIRVDSTMNYTLAFRIASSSTSVNFRPGFRFYSDPNCTEANRITNVATNARILTPANYAGQSALIGAGSDPNWQSGNASLTYNNGITCNCNVTGADFNVATASTWTPTRNFAITFRVPNAYSSSSTIAQSMRVFILENTAANPNQIFVDDAVLSEGPVNPSVPLTAGVSDSVNPTVYGNLAVDGSLTVGGSALPAALTSGTPTANDCAAFASSTVTNIQDAGSACPSQFTKFSMGIASSGQAPGATNQIDVSVVYLPNIQFSHLTVDVSTTDSSTSDFYSWAITDLSGNVKCSVTALNLTASGASDQSCTQGTVTLANGPYIFAFTGNATTAKIAYSGTAPLALSSAVSSSSSASGAMTFPISIPSAGVTYSSYGTPAIILH